MKIRITLALTLVALLLAPAFTTATASGIQRRMQVRIYFYRDGAESTRNPLGLSAVTRRVNSVAPARAALEELLDGPTAAEERRGYKGLSVAEFDIGSLVIRNGTARVNFVASRTWPGWPGDLAPGRFREAVTRTLKQFPTVQRVIVSVNGDPRFDSGEGE